MRRLNMSTRSFCVLTIMNTLSENIFTSRNTSGSPGYRPAYIRSCQLVYTRDSSHTFACTHSRQLVHIRDKLNKLLWLLKQHISLHKT